MTPHSFLELARVAIAVAGAAVLLSKTSAGEAECGITYMGLGTVLGDWWFDCVSTVQDVATDGLFVIVTKGAVGR